MDKAVGEEYINTAQRLSLQLPTAAELKEASRSIETLATEHNLQLYQLAAGKLFGNVQPDAAFSALDCYAMARYNIREHAYLRAEVWLRLALAKYQKKDIGLNALYGLAQSNMDKWLAILLIKRRQYDAALRHVNSPSYGKSATDQVLQHYESKMQFKQNCNTNLQRPTHLHCRYNTTTTPFLRIAPLKMEELSMNPYMVIYHDAISNKEIEVLLSKHLQFKPALVSDERISHQRSAKDVVIDYSDATVNQAIYARLQDMSGIEDKGTKLLSLINYGIGGHYDLHLDAYNSSHVGEPDRIATLLFYLGNVEAGGATIFPNLKLTIKPTKGSALFWHNLKSDGNIHENTLHAACPVIVGSKYVLSKWIENV
ncbi:prolyl 4-hydroxylase subunit alpha-1 [Drosophila busckii]|uniref:prolyl 4-hydroxylase subunit alpha-1 n=1 Tax=Drosophila busckii TaxID=30019 RepID=UPI00083EB4D6|nr:prolyl 4-hydroxylase subunit alpha-1 [Drosophila busckii]